MNPYAKLPDSEIVDARTLSRLFARTTNSYKFLFFLAILENLERNRFDINVPMSLHELSIDMLVIAWYPHVYFRLDFGTQDRIGQVLDRIFKGGLDCRSLKPTPSDRLAVRKSIELSATSTEFERYVPYRLIRPFFPETSRLDNDNQVNLKVAELAEQYFVSRKPPYRFNSNRNEIFLHPCWGAYLEQNFKIVKSWVYWEFLQYMQRRNPNVPAVSSKLLPPLERQSLVKETKYWRKIMEKVEICCIYSGERLNSGNFSLDHYIPWSFVVHNQLWNLVPVLPEVNSSKSDRLPSREYLSRLIDVQYIALKSVSQIFAGKARDDFYSSYFSDLALSDIGSILDREKLEIAYQSTISPLLQLAKVNGFESDWKFKQD